MFNRILISPFISLFKINQKSLLHLISLLCIFSFTFLLFYIYTKYFIKWDIFTARDIQRAVDWLDGRFYWSGPEMSGGGHLPGPFFYFLLFPPLLFGENTYSQSLLWHITWLSFTYTTAFHFITKIMAYKESILIFLIAFITFSEGCLLSLGFAWNPSFAILFHIFAIMGLYFWRKTDKDLYLYLTGLAIALGVQIHFLVSVHVVTTLFFYCFGTKKSWKPILLFVFFISPFFVFGMLSSLNVFGASAIQLHYHLRWLIKNTFSERWFENINLFISTDYIMPVVFLSFLTLGMKWKVKKWPVTPLTRDFFIMILIPCLAAILVAGNNWYLYFIPVFLIFFFSKWFDDLMPDNEHKRFYFLIICVILFMISIFLFENKAHIFSVPYLLSAVKSFHFILPAIPLTVFLFMNRGKNTWWHFGRTSFLLLSCFFIMQVKVIERFQPYGGPIPKSFSVVWPLYQDVSPLMKRILMETNWSPTEAMKRLYTIGIHPETSLVAHYSMVKEQMNKEKLNNTIDGFYSNNKTELSSRGYMIIQHLKRFIGYSHADWKQYLSHSSLLSHFLRKEISEERIQLKTPKLYDTHWLIPYQTTKESFFPESFSNIGQPYYWEEPKWLKNCAFTQQFQKGYEFYYCIVLPGYLRRAGVHVKLSSKSQNEVASPFAILDITFLGSMIGAADCCSNRGYTLWSDTHIFISCNEKRIRYNLPNTGVNHEFQKKDVTERAKNLSAPLKLSIPIKKSAEFPGCNRDEIQAIELMFNMRKDFGPVEKKRIIWKTEQSDTDKIFMRQPLN